jgi:hypothetical protein
VDEGDDAAGAFVMGGRKMTVDREFETVLRFVVGNDVVHASNSLAVIGGCGPGANAITP